MPSPEQLEELQKLLPQVATPDTTLAVINGQAIAAKNLVAELSKIPQKDIASLIEDLKTLDKLEKKCPGCDGKGYVTFGADNQYAETCKACRTLGIKEDQ